MTFHGKTGGGAGSRYPHLLPNLFWILWMLELIVVKAWNPSSLAPATKTMGETESGSRPGPFFLDFMDQKIARVISWDINVPLKQPKRKSWDKHLGRVSFGFNCFSHLGQDSQHLLCKKKRISFPSC